MLRLCQDAAGGPNPTGGVDQAFTPAPPNTRSTHQVGHAELDIPIKSLEQTMNIASDDVSAIPNDASLVPGEKRI